MIMQSSINHTDRKGSHSSRSNVELTLLGIDKKWVRSEGSWVDKSKLPASITHDEFPTMAIEKTPSQSLVAILEGLIVQGFLRRSFNQQFTSKKIPSLPMVIGTRRDCKVFLEY